MSPATMLSLYHKFFEKHATIVGIDIGTHNYLSASDLNMDVVYTDETNEMSRIYNKYKRRLKQPNINNEETERKFLKGMHKHTNKVVKDLKDLYPSPCVFIIGRGDGVNRADTLYGKIFTYTYRAIMKYADSYDSVVCIDEGFTSLICPECTFMHKRNRKQSNRFECGSCGYQNDNDDIVAACNIAHKWFDEFMPCDITLGKDE